ncbi:MAG: Virginiamycin B lyase, partial [Candidatus Eremiobacteraeota bacterium]|nr:Virginiamycin B lyase [Candidatus Eremiobacteraeota bacterium]
AGPDGNVWFAEEGTHKIGVITPAGVIKELPLPGGSFPSAITAGPDGNMWFTDYFGKVGSMTMLGAVTEFGNGITGDQVTAIVAGPDGNLYFVVGQGNQIGKVTTGGSITEYAANDTPQGIALGPDGNIWFTEFCTSKVARLQ